MIRVQHADAVDLLKSIPRGTVRCIVTDPPYGIAYHSNRYKERNPHAPIANDWNFDVASFFEAGSDALQEGGAMYVCTRWDVLLLWAGWLPPSLTLKNVIVWVKDNWTSGDLQGDYGGQHELVMYIVKGRHLRVGPRLPNVWSVPRVPAKRMLHPTEKPVSLFARALTFSVSPGDLVVDPFCGSGTLGIAARDAGAEAILGDLDPKMVELTCSRLQLEPPRLPPTRKPVPAVCPVFRITPPELHLWGLHPEDVLQARGESSAPVNAYDLPDEWDLSQP